MYRQRLPQLDGGLFITDGGLETTLIFHRGLDLPAFAAFDLLKDDEGTEQLRRYYTPYAVLARERGAGLILESPTWRANPDWAAEIGYSLDELDALNRKAIGLMEEIREEHASEHPIVISGCVGPQGDGYSPERMLTPEEAHRYHSTQIETFADTAADMVTAITMTYPEEAIGVTRAAVENGLPVVISFTLETDGRLPSGQALGGAIQQVDDDTQAGPAYYMINCAHPTHFEDVLESGAPWVDRIRGLRANASTKSHAELDEATELDEGDPADLGERHAALRTQAAARERARRLLWDGRAARHLDLHRLARRRLRPNVENPRMRVSAKVDYALRALAELAAAPPGQPVKGEQLATTQEIPLNFLENILLELRRSELVASRRGADGGYWLGRPAAEISLADVVRAVEGPIASVRGSRPEDVTYTGAATALQDVWIELRASMRGVLEEISLADLVERSTSPR